MKKITFKNAFVRLFTLLVVAVSFNSCVKELYCGEDSLANPDRSDAKSILSFEFSKSQNPNLAADVSSKMTNMEIVLTVPFGTDVTALKPSINYFAESVTPAPEAAQNFTTPVTYTATAKNGSTSVYTVKVVVSPNIAKGISTFKLTAADNPGIGASDINATITGTNIAFTVPFGTNVTALKPAVTFTGTTLSPANLVATDFTSPVTYTVTAADGTTKTYTVTATIATSSAKDITAFMLKSSLNSGIGGMDITGTITGTNISFTVPFGTDVTALKPTITQTGNTISPANEAATNFTGPVTYTVTAQDGTTKTYTATVTITASSNKDITSFIVKNSLNPAMDWTDVTGVITGTNIAIELPAGTDVTALKPTFVHTGNTVSTASEVARDFTSPQTYTVTAQDGSTKVYTVTATVRTADVYIAGFESNGTKSVAKYWKNGVATSLTDGTQSAWAMAIQVVGTDVYVAGYESNGTKAVAKVWKNGVATSLTDGTQNAEARAITVVGTDVYVAGNESNGTVNVAKYWKNGVATTLGLGVANSYGQGITVDGTDVYVAGEESGGKIWKNGVATAIAGTSGIGNIVIDGADVYGSTTTGGKSGYVKNGVTTTLGAAGGQSYSMAISNGDIYVAGSDGTNVFKLWKNGVATNLTTGANGIINYILAVRVLRSDVYVAFMENIAGVNAIKLYKNGVITNITDGSKQARSWTHSCLYIVR